VIDKGRIAEIGNHQQLLDKDGIYAKLVSRQLAKRANLIEADEAEAKIKPKLEAR
jgi:ABC-type transport system involved in cytochrome bd biosynthesis fused ATPase/permease subunit